MFYDKHTTQIHGTGEFIVLCSYCRRRRVDGVWLASLPPPAGAMVSHGICDDCYEKLMETLDKEEGL